MKFKNTLIVNLSLMLLGLSFSTYANASNVNTANITSLGQAQTPLLVAKGGTHTNKARPSTAEKHQKGQKAKKDAQENKEFKAAKQKNPKLSKAKILKSLKK
jgi:hypothetical protein